MAVKSPPISPDLLAASLDILFQDLIDQESKSVYFELHRAIKLGYYTALYPPTDPILKQTAQSVTTTPVVDIFGQGQSAKKVVDCICPQCKRTLAATRLAPHLEKCMGMGRNSSRIASRRIQASGRQAAILGDQEPENEYESDEYVPNDSKKQKFNSNLKNNRKIQKEKK
ncbi:Ataxin-7-like protein 3 [Oopsacas minuta]|uniref:SAGA-associated factor 11 n=1 Tax=Oopsacas minuta TaxID=111878 RepID=A0AAV7K6K4_9METZ|nr:Ataxin-7-like protein 3 [Oopsacas minuta]